MIINDLVLYLTIMDVDFGYIIDGNVVRLRIFLDGEEDELLWRDKK